MTRMHYFPYEKFIQLQSHCLTHLKHLYTFKFNCISEVAFKQIVVK